MSSAPRRSKWVKKRGIVRGGARVEKHQMCNSIGNQHGGALQSSTAQVRERAVRVRQFVFTCVCFHRHAGRQSEKLAGVPTRKVRDRSDHALLPQQTVRKRWNV